MILCGSGCGRNHMRSCRDRMGGCRTGSGRTNNRGDIRAGTPGDQHRGAASGIREESDLIFSKEGVDGYRNNDHRVGMCCRKTQAR